MNGEKVKKAGDWRSVWLSFELNLGRIEVAQLPPTTTAMSASPFSSAHRLYVKSLYKRMLKNELDWIVRRDIWRAKAQQIRAEFELNR
jgi:hypothetical protein